MSDEERAAVDGDVQALDLLLARLKVVPVPSDVLSAREIGTFIPFGSIHSSKTQENNGPRRILPEY